MVKNTIEMLRDSKLETTYLNTLFAFYTLKGTSGGTSLDWAKGSGIFKYSQTLELRDEGEYGFLLPTEEIKPCAEETLAALMACAQMLLV